MDRRGQSTAYPAGAGAGRGGGGGGGGGRMMLRPKNLVLGIVATLVVVMVFLNSAKVDHVGREAVGKLQHAVPDHIPRPFAGLHNPFKQPAHPPPVQANSTLGETSWFSDWKWLNPFSSTVTLNEDRALLPPIIARPPVYTYYEPRDREKEPELKRSEDRLLEIWRKAWWSQGFRPVILGAQEAMENPLYAKMSTVNATEGVQLELMRFMAWSHMGDGILANWLVMPMAGYDHPLLSYLREGRYPTLTRYQDLGMGLFAGPKAELDRAIDVFFEQKKHVEADESLYELITGEKEELFHIEGRRRGVAFYNSKVIAEKYTDISDVVKQSPAKGYEMLAELITAHLHATFLAQYRDGIAVLSPHPGFATLLSHRALALAQSLNTCPSDPTGPVGATPGKLSSCPPNANDCQPCRPVALTFPPSAPFNTSTIFTIGTVPHTFTLARLLAPHDAGFNFSVAHIRRKTARDRFVDTVAAAISPQRVASQSRLIQLKETVAQPGKGAMRSIWRPAEQDWSWESLEWRLGFSLPRGSDPEVRDAAGQPVPEREISGIENLILGTRPASGGGTSGGGGEQGEFKVPESLRPLLDSMKENQPLRSDLPLQAALIRQTGDMLAAKAWAGEGGERADMRRVCEAWNLADHEAWRFVRALAAREEVERVRWMEEERKYHP